MQQSSDEANLTMAVTKNNDSLYNLFRNLSTGRPDIHTFRPS